MKTISYTKPIARKDHRCNFCRQVIQATTCYDYSVHTYEGQIYSWKTHSRCSAIANRLKMYDYYDDGVTQEDFQNDINEEYYKLSLDRRPSVMTFTDRLDYVLECHNL